MQSSSRPLYFIDTNVFLELEFQDARWEECRGFLKKVETGEVSACSSDFVVYGAILEIEAKTRKRSELKIETFLDALLSLSGLSILRPTIKEMKDAAKFVSSRKLDFDDAYVVSCMTANEITSIVSFDRHFDNLEEVRRLEPIEILRAVESDGKGA